VDALTAIAESGGQVPLVSLADAASAVLPVVEVSPADAASLGFGQRIPAAGGTRPEGDAVAILNGVAVAVIRAHEGRWKPAIVFEPSQR
jgi:tRNA pseudouridine55 synthase